MAMQKAEGTTTDEHRAEYLRVAQHWLKLSSEISEVAALLADA
jgi:hypothetical protein